MAIFAFSTGKFLHGLRPLWPRKLVMNWHGGTKSPSSSHLRRTRKTHAQGGGIAKEDIPAEDAGFSCYSSKNVRGKGCAINAIWQIALNLFSNKMHPSSRQGSTACTASADVITASRCENAPPGAQNAARTQSHLKWKIPLVMRTGACVL